MTRSDEQTAAPATESGAESTATPVWDDEPSLPEVASQPAVPARAKASRARRMRGWVLFSWPLILLVVAGMYVSAAATLQHSQAMSPIDEWMYIDYLDRVLSDGYVRKGEHVEPPALERMACDGVFPYGPMGPACGSHDNDPAKYPFGGKQSADPYTPIYFWITRAGGAVIWRLAHVDGLTAWRLTGSLWMGATLVALWCLLIAWKVPRLVAVALGLLFVASTYAYWTYSYISTDAPAAFFGALILLAVTQFVRGRGSPWCIVALSVLAVAIKVTNILAVGLGVLFLAGYGVARLLGPLLPSSRRDPELLALTSTRTEGPKPRIWLWAVVAAGTAAAAQLAWMVVNRLTAIGETAAQGVTSPLTPWGAYQLTVRFLDETITSNVIVTGSGGNTAFPLPSAWTTPQTWIVIAGVVGSVLLLRASTMVTEPDRWALVMTVGIASVTFAPALALMLTIATGSYFELPPRYGGVLLPGMLLLGGLLFRNRWVAVGVIGYSAVLALKILTMAATYR